MTSMTLIDLQKTFGIIDHDVLLQKFDIGFSKYSVNWFKLYLSSRSFLVILGNNFSQPASVSCSAPQGSLLGLPLFSVYVNDMSQIIKCAFFSLLMKHVLPVKIKILIKMKISEMKIFVIYVIGLWIIS